jgi:hypothetical protein
MKYVLGLLFSILLLCSESCDSQIPIFITAAKSESQATVSLLDYTSNLLDEWVGNRGFVINTDNTNIGTWSGYRNGLVLTPTSNYGKPSSSDVTQAANNAGFTLPASLAVTGDVTFAFVIKSAARQNAEQRLFHAVGTPQMILNLEISAANGNMGMLYNSQSLNFGTAFPFDNQYHTLVFKINSGVNASVYLDGTKVGNTVTFSSSTAINWTANSTRRIFRTASTGTVSFVGAARKVRIYKEALSDDNIAIIGNHSNAFFVKVTDDRSIYRNYNIGQSNANGSGIVVGDLEPELQGVMPNVFIWDFNIRKWIPMDPNNRPVNSGIGPIFRTAWLIHEAHPNDLVYLNNYAYGGTSLAVDWAVGTGVRYLEWFQYLAASNVILEIEERIPNTINTYITWAQGENDAQVQAQALAYQTNEFNFITDITSRIGVTDIRCMNLHNRLNLGNFPYRETVRAAKLVNTASFPDLFIITPDDAVVYPVSVDGVHYTWTGYENYATDLFNKP